MKPRAITAWLIAPWIALAPMGVIAAAVPLGLPPLTYPADNPPTAQKVALGKRLFFDQRLSADQSISCASCHQPERFFTDGLPVAKGVLGQTGTRNAPSLQNVGYQTVLLWDGRRTSLEAQVAAPFINPQEHGLTSHEQVLAIVRTDPLYRQGFAEDFGLKTEEVETTHVFQALASYLRSLLAGDSAFDRYAYAQDKTALNDAARHGLALFQGRAQCATCHTVGTASALFTDQQFHRVGIGLDKVTSKLAVLATRVATTSPKGLDRLILADPEIAALGRFVVTHNPADIGKFRTPSLRNVARTAPYMHDGSVPTLEEAIEREVYYRGNEAGRPLLLTPQEKADLVEFLKALSSPPDIQPGR